MQGDYLKVLIIGQSFNKSSGGGITLTNMFAAWPGDKIALATFGLGMINISNSSKTNNVYQLGSDEISVNFPFSLFKKRFRSGVVKQNSNQIKDSIKLSKKNPPLRLYLLNTIFPFIKKTGIYNFSEKISLSQRFVSWVREFEPDIIYTQLGSVALANFVNEASVSLNIPIIVHIMDDWPSTIPGYFGFLFKNKINKSIQRFFNNCSLHLSISDYMATEYEKRYGHSWVAFHNSIDTSKWNLKMNKNEKSSDLFKILYLGRIGIANAKSVMDFSRTISKLEVKNRKVEFHIYSFSENEKQIKKINALKNVYWHSSVAHNEVPALMQKFDLLLLPLDFTRNGRKYAKYSMPTKMSEYMISGVPSLVFAPEDCAVTKYASENKVSFICSENSENYLIKSLQEIIKDNNARTKISEHAFKIAKESHDINKEHIRFLELINNNLKKC